MWNTAKKRRPQSAFCLKFPTFSYQCYQWFRKGSVTYLFRGVNSIESAISKTKKSWKMGDFDGIFPVEQLKRTQVESGEFRDFIEIFKIKMCIYGKISKILTIYMFLLANRTVLLSLSVSLSIGEHKIFKKKKQELLNFYWKSCEMFLGWNWKKLFFSEKWKNFKISLKKKFPAKFDF